MKLSEYMSLKGISDEEMGAKLSKDSTTIFRYRRGNVAPPLTVIAEIERITDNAVSFRDFLPESAA